MKLLGIDYGSKRVGIALKKKKGEFAIPFSVLNFSKNILNEVIDLAKEKEIKEIVMGESKNYKGEANAILKDSLNFKSELEKQGYIVHLEPEFMTSANAERFQGKNDLIDASAAALILQSFLDKRNVKR